MKCTVSLFWKKCSKTDKKAGAYLILIRQLFSPSHLIPGANTKSSFCWVHPKPVRGSYCYSCMPLVLNDWAIIIIWSTWDMPRFRGTQKRCENLDFQKRANFWITFHKKLNRCVSLSESTTQIPRADSLSETHRSEIDKKLAQFLKIEVLASLLGTSKPGHISCWSYNYFCMPLVLNDWAK